MATIMTSVMPADPSDLLSQWTEDQESALLKAITRYKPVGMHKHFRMLAIRSSMLDSGTVNSDDGHTSIHGIWQKLGSLYDLPKLDEREDSVVNDSLPGDEESSDSSDERDMSTAKYWRDFELPRDDYEAMMWERRLKADGSESPSWSRRESTIADTDEPRSSPVSTAGGRGSVRGQGRGGASAKRGAAGRLSKLQIELESERSTSRRASKTGSAVDEDSVMEDVADEDEDGDENVHDSVEGGGEDESETGEDEEKKTTSRRSGRVGRTGTPLASGRKGRGRRGRRRG